MNVAMTTVTADLLEEMVDAVVRETDPVRVILFGSRATGAAGPEADVDLLVVEGQPFGPGHTRHQELNRIRRALAGFTTPIDILVYTSDEVEKWKDTTNHIVRTILREGKVLFERSRSF